MHECVFCYIISHSFYMYWHRKLLLASINIQIKFKVYLKNAYRLFNFIHLHNIVLFVSSIIITKSYILVIIIEKTRIHKTHQYFCSIFFFFFATNIEILMLYLVMLNIHAVYLLHYVNPREIILIFSFCNIREMNLLFRYRTCYKYIMLQTENSFYELTKNVKM